jgi:hypothetical protein
MRSCLTNWSLPGNDNIDSDDDSDATDMIDADAFEIFNSDLQVDCSAATIPISDLEPVPPSTPPTIQLEADNSESTSLVVIDQFPFGDPGAPISGAHQGSPVDDTGCDALGDPIWAPFQSKHDWDIAYWAKRNNLTLSAVAEFLAIPEVRKHILT